MSSFLFFVLLTMVMAFLMNYLFMQYFYVCSDCSHGSKHTLETQKMCQSMGDTTDGDDIDAFLD